MNWSRVFLFSVAVAAVVLLSTDARPTLAISSTVDTTSDANLTACTAAPGDCSLRGAISQATAGGDTITFNIPAASDAGCVVATGICTISPSSALPTITAHLTIDGFSQPGTLQNTNPMTQGSSAALKIVLSGNGAGMGANGLLLDHTIMGATIIQGLVINGFSGAGIRIENADNVFVRGNYIGTDAQGGTDLGNGGHGVQVLGGNSINNIIGGTLAAHRNVISGNQGSGVLLTGGGHQLQGNFIGVSASGAADLGNSFDGVTISGANTICIGGSTIGLCTPTVAARNVISGNDSDGIDMQGAGATNNRIVNNYIGLQVDGVSAQGNTSQGIQAINSASTNIIGTTAGSNRIAFNGGAGVFIDSGSTGDAIRANNIHSNGGGVTTLGIELSPLGVTGNDAGDGDTGANNLQNFPELISAVKKGSSTLIAGSINSTAGATFDVDFFVSDSCDPSGNGEGATYIGTSAGVGPTDGANAFSFAFSAGISLIGKFITATATRTAAPLDTSEFSNCVTVGPMVVDTTSDATLTACTPATPGDCSLRGALANANTAASPGDLINFNIPAGSAGCVGAVDPVCTIAIGSALPVLTINGGGSDTIDGAGASVIIKGAEAQSYICIGLDSSGNTVRNLELTDCAHGIACCGGNTNNTIGPGITAYDSNTGVSITGTSNTVIGNRFGINDEGTAVHPDGGNNFGVALAGDNNTVGGTSAPDRNIISGNATLGIYTQSGADSNSIKGNFIGTDASGTVDLGNTVGVFILNAANNCIGGTIVASVCTSSAGSGNLISGNNQNGIEIQGAAATGNIVIGNKIGTDVTGTTALLNNVGVLILNSPNNTIGNGAGDGNLIAGNANRGVDVTGSGNIIRGNLIGTAADGTTALGNGAAGVIIRGAASNDNFVGGTDAGQANTIAFNFGDGVTVSAGTGNRIRGNSIHSNSLLGIENVGGGNGEPGHAPPVITAVGSASGMACADCTVDVYSDSGDEGQVWHGSVIADSGGNWKYFGPVTGPNITATATNASGSTSEFSAAFACGDFDADTISDCSDSEDDGDGFSDEAEGGIALCKNAVNDDSFDAESLFFVNDGCPAIGIPEVNCGGNLDNDFDGFPNDGCPKDGSFSEAEFKIGTGSLDPCGNNGWPLELVSTPEFTANKFNISDLGSFVSGLKKLGKSPGQAGFDSRWDLEPGNSGLTSSGWINIVDLGRTVSGATGFPPMLGGAKALGGPVCPFPP